MPPILSTGPESTQADPTQTRPALSRRAVTALEARAIPHAVVGGHAVAAWVARIDPAAVRTTVDVELLANPDG